MKFVRPQPPQVALDKLGSRSPVAAMLDSAAWADVPVALRERAFFSATIEDVRWLQGAHDFLGDFLAANRETLPNGEVALKAGGRADFIKQLQDFAEARGLGPLDPNDSGTIKDIRSAGRLGMIFDVQTQAAHDYADWKAGQDPDLLDAFPAQRFIRARSVRAPRPFHEANRGIVRLKTDTSFWVSMNRDFGVPWGPWGFNSGMDVEDVSREEAELLGLLRPGELVQPVDQDFTDNLQASLRGISPNLRNWLQSVFRDQVVIDGDTVRWAHARPATPPPARSPDPMPPQPPTSPEFEGDVVKFVTGEERPGRINNIGLEPVTPGWWATVPDAPIAEPPPLKRVDRASVLVREPDGRIWIVEPTNHFGNRRFSLPGGGVERGFSTQQNALKEVWEETGLQVRITGFAGDFRDSNNGNNGRLYFGERIGGAPWDAKVESFIRDQRGFPAAESQSVQLVTPDEAASLLHRTDDLAQLMTIRPIQVDQSTRGKGSEPLKKFVNALEPAARHYEASIPRGAYHGNSVFHAGADLRGYNALPTAVAKADFDAMIQRGEVTQMLRGMSNAGHFTGMDFFDAYVTGDHFAGHGIFGTGSYADSNSGRRNVASQYAGPGGVVMRVGLRKDARVIDVDELERKVPLHPREFKGYSRGKTPQECWLGLQAMLAGYDAIYINGRSRRHGGYGKGFYVILNRAKVVVQDTPVASNFTLP